MDGRELEVGVSECGRVICREFIFVLDLREWVLTIDVSHTVRRASRSSVDGRVACPVTTCAVHKYDLYKPG